MKIRSKILKICLFLTLSAFVFTTTSSCARGVGCPAQDNISVKTNKKGQLKGKKGKQQLFSKKMRRN